MLTGYHVTQLTTGDSIYQVWNAVSGQLLSTHEDPQRSLHISVLTWSADSQRILSTILGSGTTIDVWSDATGKTLTTFSYSSLVAASQDGKYVAVGTSGKVHIWDAAAGKQLLTFDTKSGSVVRPDCSPDGKRLVSA